MTGVIFLIYKEAISQTHGFTLLYSLPPSHKLFGWLADWLVVRLSFLPCARRLHEAIDLFQPPEEQVQTAVNMGRMHSAGKGMSKSARPYKRTPPSWLKVSSADVEDHICKFAKKGLTPSQIGVILRDSHGIAQVKSVTGSKVLRLLKKNGASPIATAYVGVLFGPSMC